MNHRKRQATYITPTHLTGARRRAVPLGVALTSLLLVLTFIISTLPTNLLQSPVAHADTRSDFEAAAQDFGVNGGEGQENFEEKITEVFDDSRGRDWKTNPPAVPQFDYALWRLFSTNYMNRVDRAVPAGTFPSPSSLPVRNSICNANDPGRGTINYHNCDIPNITTEFLQSIVALVDPTGVQGATVQSAEVAHRFGLPSTIPTPDVPVDPAARSVKYTGLELLGYNMRYTTYLGEWDNIKVMTSARALSNFGLMDTLHLGVQAVINGITGGLQAGINGFIDGWRNGGPLGALWGGITSTLGGAASGVILTVLDTSDYNVYNTMAWYRSGFGSTLYTGAELTQVEVQSNLYIMIMEYLNANGPEAAQLPPDFLAIRNAPPEPLDDISSCVITTVDAVTGEERSQVWGASSTAPGPSQAACQLQAESVEGTASWSVDGTQQGETLQEWRDKNGTFFNTASQYGVACTIDTSSESNRASKLVAFYSCWPGAWEARTPEILRNEQTTIAQDWYLQLLGYDAIMNWLSQKKEFNVNAPWNRFACTDSKGEKIQVKVVKTGYSTEDLYQYKMVYKNDGSGQVNPGCDPLRPPIQDGYFGNGYPSNGQPGTDTRRELVQPMSLGKLFFDQTAAGTNLANGGLAVSQFVTQLTNTILDFSFSPIMDKLGLKDQIIIFVEAFRDSIFFPLVFLLLALGGLTVLIDAGRKRTYGRGLISLLLIMGTFFLSVIALMRMDLILKVVDEGPAYIETAIVGTIFGFGNGSDDLCIATQSGGTQLYGLKDEPLPFNPQSNVRTLSCEVWRVWVFDPWVAGQFGTGYDSLYAATSGQPLRMSNSNTALVGDASVVMGGGVTVKNWALYQATVMASGTSTTPDPGKVTGSFPKDIYRLVDLQGGPNNGAASDGRYFHAWSGQDPSARVVISLISVPSAIVGLLAVGSFALSKIILTFTSLIMLLFLPFMLLIGVHPTFGRMQLKGYIGTILSLMYQRIVLVTLLAVMLRVLIGFSSTGGNPAFNAFMALIIGLLFLFNKKTILEYAHADTSRTMGQHFTSSFAKGPAGAMAGMLPLSARNRLSQGQVALRAGVGGALGGFIVGGAAGARKGVEAQGGHGARREERKQRRAGFGLVQSFASAADEARADLRRPTSDWRVGKSMDAVRKDIEGKAVKEKSAAGMVNPETSKVELREWRPNTTGSGKEYKDLRRMVDLQAKIEDLQAKIKATPEEATLPPMDLKAPTPQKLREQVQAAQGHLTPDEAQLKEWEDEYEALVEKQVQSYYEELREDPEKNVYTFNPLQAMNNDLARMKREMQLARESLAGRAGDYRDQEVRVKEFRADKDLLKEYRSGLKDEWVRDDYA